MIKNTPKEDIMERRTRLGKIVGSQPNHGNQWYTQPASDMSEWYVVAPSGAKMETYPTSAAAKRRRDQIMREGY